jgi:hypothetical protein
VTWPWELWRKVRAVSNPTGGKRPGSLISDAWLGSSQFAVPRPSFSSSIETTAQAAHCHTHPTTSLACARRQTDFSFKLCHNYCILRWTHPDHPSFTPSSVSHCYNSCRKDTCGSTPILFQPWPCLYALMIMHEGGYGLRSLRTCTYGSGQCGQVLDFAWTAFTFWDSQFSSRLSEIIALL